MDKTRLVELGWTQFYSQQLNSEELSDCVPGRVISVQRSGMRVATETRELDVTMAGHWFEADSEQRPTVGDWVLLSADGQTAVRLLERTSVFKRVAAGGRGEIQLIAANVDTVFIVSSCNDEFNLSRLERYLALAIEARVEPVVVLTKVDLVDSPDSYLEQARSVRPGLHVELVNALDRETLNGVRAWCRPGHTVALMGSSGVGKSTLLNSLSGERVQDTGGVRESDKRGRHITSHRSLHLLPEGGLLLDSPGMRELQIVDVEHGVSEMFEDIETLILTCRFSDCSHESEPGCAVREALADGSLDERRLNNYHKLLREEARNTETLADRHQRARQWSRQVKLRNDLSHKKR